MFKANNQNVYVASKSQSVKPDVVSDVLPLDQIRLLIPSFVGFVDPNETYLKFDLEITNARGVIVPDKKAGAHALFRNVLLRDGGNTTTLENLEDYNAQAAMLRPYTQQSSIHHKRELFEGVQQDANNSGASLYYAAPNDLTGTTTRLNANTDPRTARKIEVYLQLRAGLFGGGIVPVALMNGLRIQIDTEDPLRCLHQPFIGGSLENGIANCHAPNADVAQDAYSRDGANAASNIGGIETNIQTTAAGENNPFAIGDILYLNHDTGGNDQFTNELVLGVVDGFYISGGTQLGIRFILQSNTGDNVPANANYSQANNTKLYYKISDREKRLNVLSAANLTNNADRVIEPPSYRISNLEMLCQAVTPPSSYVEGMLKKSMSDQGVQIDYMTSELHRYNQVNTQGLVQIQVPTLAERAKSVLVQPILNSSFRSLQNSSFSGVPDNARNYQFIKGNELVPSRLVNLERYSQAVGGSTARRNEPLHTSELQKALVNLGASVYSLQNIHDNFIIARAFNKYGQITNLADETLSLKVDYDAGSQKIFNTYIYKLARLVIAKGMVQVVS
jgi:hypothetical protein